MITDFGLQRIVNCCDPPSNTHSSVRRRGRNGNARILLENGLSERFRFVNDVLERLELQKGTRWAEGTETLPVETHLFREK